MGLCCSKQQKPIQISEEDAIYVLSITNPKFWTNPMYENIRSKYRYNMDVIQELEKSTRLAVKRECAKSSQEVLDYCNSESVKLWRADTAIQIRDELLKEFNEYEEKSMKELKEKYGELSPENHGHYFKVISFNTNVKSRIVETCRSFVDSTQFLSREDIYEFFMNDLTICEWKQPEKYKQKMEEALLRSRESANFRIRM